MACMNGFYMFKWVIDDPLGSWEIAELHGDADTFRTAVRQTVERYRDSYLTSAATASVRVYRDGRYAEEFDLLPLVRFSAPGLGDLRLRDGGHTPIKVGGFPDWEGPYRDLDRDTAWKQVPDDDVTVTIDWPPLPSLSCPALVSGHHVLLNSRTGRYLVLTREQVDRARQQPRGLVSLVEATGTTLDWLPDYIDTLTDSTPEQLWSDILLELDDVGVFTHGGNVIDYSHT